MNLSASTLQLIKIMSGFVAIVEADVNHVGPASRPLVDLGARAFGIGDTVNGRHTGGQLRRCGRVDGLAKVRLAIPGTAEQRRKP